MDSLKPFSEEREVLASVEFKVPQHVVRTIEVRSPLTSTHLDVIKPVSVQCADFVVEIHVNMAIDVNACCGNKFWLLAVEATGVPDGADVWLSGAFSSRARSWLEVAPKMRIPPLVRAPTAWLRADGRLAAFVFGYTQEIVGTVTVFGPPAAHLKAHFDVSFGFLRDLAGMSDVVLRVAGEALPLHRVVLAVRSPVLRAMLAKDADGAKQEEVDVVVDCSAEVFGVFLDFLYTGVLGERGCDDLLHLLLLGERFEVAELPRECARQLFAAPGGSHALAAFRFGLERPSFPDAVRARAADVIVRHWAAVSASEEWRQFAAAHPTVCTTLRAFVPADCKVKSEELKCAP